VQTNPAVKQSKIIIWSGSPWNQSGRKGKGLWRKGFEMALYGYRATDMQISSAVYRSILCE